MHQTTWQYHAVPQFHIISHNFTMVFHHLGRSWQYRHGVVQVHFDLFLSSLLGTPTAKGANPAKVAPKTRALADDTSVPFNSLRNLIELIELRHTETSGIPRTDDFQWCWHMWTIWTRWVEQPTSTSGAAPGSVAALHWPVAYGGVQLLHCPLHWTFHAVWGFSVSWFLYLGLSCLYLPLALAFYPCWSPCNFAAFVSVQRALKGLCVGSVWVWVCTAPSAHVCTCLRVWQTIWDPSTSVMTATCRHLWAPWRRAIFLNLARSTEVVSATLFRSKACFNLREVYNGYTLTYGSYGPSPKSGVTYFFVESVESLRMSLLGAVAIGAESQKA